MLLEVDSGASSVLELGGTVSTSTSFTYLNTSGFSGTLLLANSSALGSFETNGVISGMHVATGAGVIPDRFAGSAPDRSWHHGTPPIS